MISYGSGSEESLEWNEDNLDIYFNDIDAQIYSYSNLNVPENSSVELNFAPQLSDNVEIELYAGIGYDLDFVATVKK